MQIQRQIQEIVDFSETVFINNAAYIFSIPFLYLKTDIFFLFLHTCCYNEEISKPY